MSREKQSQYDRMTGQPVEKLILELGLPTTISMLVTNLYNMADTYFVGTLGTSASGATGVVFGLMAILQALGFMFGNGAGSIVSRRLGAKDVEDARRYSATSFYAALLSGILVLVLGLCFLTPLVRLLGSTDTILPFARGYAFYILLAAPAMVSSCVMNNILRYEGRAFFAMIGLTSGGFLNIFLDAYFIRVLHMGIEGAGLATAISQYLSFGILLSMFLRKKTQTTFEIRYISFTVKTLGEIVTTGLPSLARQGLASISTMVLNHTAGVYGDAAIAAMSIVNRISMFIFSVGLGIGQGFQPVAGFNYGAGKFSRVKKGFYFTWIFGTVMLGVFAMVGFFTAGTVVAWFRNDLQVIAIGIPAMRAQCLALFFAPFSVCNNMLFQSIGYKRNATFLSTLRNGLCFIPLILVMQAFLGIAGVQYAQAVADVLAGLICIPFTVAFFRKLPADREG